CGQKIESLHHYGDFAVRLPNGAYQWTSCAVVAAQLRQAFDRSPCPEKLLKNLTVVDPYLDYLPPVHHTPESIDEVRIASGYEEFDYDAQISDVREQTPNDVSQFFNNLCDNCGSYHISYRFLGKWTRAGGCLQALIRNSP